MATYVRKNGSGFQSVGGVFGAGSVSLSSPFASAATVGDTCFLIFGYIDGSSGCTVSSITDSGGNTWHVDAQLFQPTNAYIRGLCIASARITATPGTITVNWSKTDVTRILWEIQEFSGVDLSPFDKSATNDHSSSTATSLTVGPTATTTQANELVIGAFYCDADSSGGTGTFSVDTGAGFAGVTPAQLNTGAAYYSSLCVEYKNVSATGTQTATGTLSQARRYIALVATYKASAAASSIKTVEGVSYPTSVKTALGVAQASVKKIEGVA